MQDSISLGDSASRYNFLHLSWTILTPPVMADLRGLCPRWLAGLEFCSGWLTLSGFLGSDKIYQVTSWQIACHLSVLN